MFKGMRYEFRYVKHKKGYLVGRFYFNPRAGRNYRAIFHSTSKLYLCVDARATSNRLTRKTVAAGPRNWRYGSKSFNT